MGLQGPKRQGKAAQERRGNPGKRAAKKPAGKPRKARSKAAAAAPVSPETQAAGSPYPPPDWLGPAAKQHWHRLAPIVAKRGLFTELDQDALTLYCDAWQQLADADVTLERDGEYVVMEKSGTIYAHPAVAKRNKSIDRIRKVGEQLGLTPNSRRGLDVDAATQDPLTAFLSKKP